MPENITDISDRGWDDLSDADRDVLQELAKERDGIDGRKSSDALAAGLLAYDGRVDEIPEDYREEHRDVIDAALEGSTNPDAEVEGVEDEEPDEAPEDESGNEAEAEADGGTAKPSTLTEAEFIVPAEHVEEWLNHVNTLVEEAKLTFKPEGWYTRAVDPANVGMVEAQLDAEAFESYTLSEETLIGINTERLEDVVESASSGDLVHAELNPETRKLNLSFGGHSFTLALIDPDSIRKQPDLPDLDLPVDVTFNEARDLDRAIRFADEVSDHIAFAADHDTFTVYAEGDTDDYRGTFEDGEEVTFDAYGEARSLFSLDYLKDMRKAWDKNEALSIDLGNEFPVQLETAIYTDDGTLGDVTYLLAPRIQSD